jgi:5-methylcytosine-specific restriction enzyme subunit McrC
MAKPITSFEHTTLSVDHQQANRCIDQDVLQAIRDHFGNQDTPYLSFTGNGIRFNQHVGVIQVGETVIEVLPKADSVKVEGNRKKVWRNVLLDMLLEVGYLKTHITSSSALEIRPNSILEAYFALFVSEVEGLLHRGLVKKYRAVEGNVTALKGSLKFGKHIQQNVTHQERFYTRHTIYDVEHILHKILYKTIGLIRRLSTQADLHCKIGALQLHFPDMPDLKVSEATFERLVYDRKTMPYKNAIDMAYLLLMNYHPDVKGGNKDVLALMFDMNLLWEKFVYLSLARSKDHQWKVDEQVERDFWRKDKNRYYQQLKPDIVIRYDQKKFVLDTKWKNLNGSNPSVEDLRQMYAYHLFFDADKVALLYPGDEEHDAKGRYADHAVDLELPARDGKFECSLIQIDVPLAKNSHDIVGAWQQAICNKIYKWCNPTSQIPASKSENFPKT